ncbi:outer membrane receptor protein involved in Fe transport [Dysgonomonas alginatilytica]|uniref:Outer membrane receptor protein involved in Fe transport n=1 Tax=Dysgonomonas alginatilytica TaxID=1605892 RepID=A0A2V3PUR0_9BACT|nr:TonB-dependent receptor [Dysgonomonas alginatilytica]PXV68041.1 outer membrane receptor protein involved in Fe transport [Dysgonomonas alginatilytica]
MEKFKLIILLLFIPIFTFAAQKLKGYVYAPDKTPVIGAQVQWENAKAGVVTDENGYFEIEGKSGKDHMLCVSYIGYTHSVTHIHSFNDLQNIILTESTELGEVVVTKSVSGRISSRTDLLKTEKLTVKELTRAACCNLGESFETNPSVDVVYSDAVTGAKQIQLLGISGNYVQMMTENFPNFRGAAKVYGLDYIPGPWMEGVQISKGAASVKNGFESISGQVNVDYKKPTTADPLSLNLFLGDVGRVEGNADAAIIVNENLSTGLFLHYSNEKRSHDANNDGFLDMPKKHQFNIMNRWHYQTGKFISQTGVKFLNDERISGQDHHTIQSDAMHDPYQIFNYTNRAEFFTKNGYVIDPDKNESVALIVSGSYHDQKSRFSDISRYNLYESNAYASLMYEKDFSPMHKISTGLSYNWDNFGQSYSIPQLVSGKQPDREAVSGAYAQYTMNLNDKLTVLAGLRADYSSLYDWFVTPRLHVKYNVSPNLYFRASAGKGYRSVFVLAENSYLLASSRTLNIADNLKQESAWNYGLSGTYHIPINGEELTFSAEWFYTDFSRQVVMDMEADPRAVSFYNLNGKSHAHVVQLEATYPLFRGFNILASYRWMNTKVNYGGKELQKPLVSDYKALLTASYETPLRKWQFDLTSQFNGGGRMPTPDAENPLWDNRFKSFVVMNAQITKFFRTWSVYAGGENLTDFIQKNPIISAENPYSENFDATMAWGPTQGRRFYLGFRYTIGK